jgi:hypothetical protein
VRQDRRLAVVLVGDDAGAGRGDQALAGAGRRGDDDQRLLSVEDFFDGVRLVLAPERVLLGGEAQVFGTGGDAVDGVEQLLLLLVVLCGAGRVAAIAIDFGGNDEDVTEF